MTSTVVYVIGGGLAGMSAAWAALKSGASVVLVDKQTLGGNSAKATSGVNAVNTRYQSVMENDSVELFLEDTYASGHSKCVRSLAEVLVAHSGRVVDALETEFNLSLPNIERLGGHSAKRTHRFQTVDNRVAPFGHIVCSTIRDRLKLIANGEKPLEDFGTLEIWENTSLVNFSISEDFHGSRIIENLEFHNSEGSNVIRNPSAVVFTAGGYAADTTSNSIIATVRKDLIGFPTTNGDFSTGDLVQLGIQKGLLTESLDQVQLHPTGFVHPMKPLEHRKFLCPEVVRGLGAILLNIDGHRFIDELAPRDTVSAGILKFGSLASDWNLTTDEGGQQKIALLLLSEEMSTNFGKPAFDFYRKIGLIFDLPDEQAFQSKLPVINYRNLLETLEMYDKFDPQSNPDPLGKAVIPLKFGAQPTLYGAYVTPALHYTMGGLAVSCDSRALIRDENKGVLPILNLFVAGENAGGVHGNNRLGGNGCLESLVFGRLSGRFSAKIARGVQKEENELEFEKSSFEVISRSDDILGKHGHKVTETLTISGPSPMRCFEHKISEIKIKTRTNEILTFTIDDLASFSSTIPGQIGLKFKNSSIIKVRIFIYIKIRSGNLSRRSGGHLHLKAEFDFCSGKLSRRSGAHL